MTWEKPFQGLNRVRSALALIASLISTTCGGDTTGPNVPTPPDATSTGTLRVSLETAGDATPSSYTVVLDGGSPRGIGASGSGTLMNLEAGEHMVELLGVPFHCTESMSSPITVTVTSGNTADLSITVTCRFVLVDVTFVVTSRGDDLDPDGYRLSVNADPARTIAANDTLVLQLEAPKSHQVSLAGRARNCLLEANTIEFVVDLETPPVEFELFCYALTGESGQLLYVSGGSSISVVETSTNTVVTGIELPSTSWGAAVSPSGFRSYLGLSNRNQSNASIAVIDLQAAELTSTIEAIPDPAENHIRNLAVSNDGSTLYGVAFSTPDLYVTMSSGNPVASVGLSDPNNEDIALSPDGSVAYISGPSAVSVVNTATLAVDNEIPVSHQASGIAVSPDGGTVFVAAGENTVVIDVATQTVVAEIPVATCANPRGFGEADIAISSDGSRLYESGAFGCPFVYVIDTGTRSVLTQIPTSGDGPAGVALSPDGSRLYVALTVDGSVDVIDTGTNRVIDTIDVASARSVVVTSF